jgi:hypothetical protein
MSNLATAALAISSSLSNKLQYLLTRFQVHTCTKSQKYCRDILNIKSTSSEHLVIHDVYYGKGKGKCKVVSVHSIKAQG